MERLYCSLLMKSAAEASLEVSNIIMSEDVSPAKFLCQ